MFSRSLRAVRRSPFPQGSEPASPTLLQRALPLALLGALAGCTAIEPDPRDREPPEVAIRAPRAGSEVADTVRVEIDARDDQGIARVTLRVDGDSVGSCATPPFAFLWASTGQPDSSWHALQAFARDAADNRGASPACSICVRRNRAPRVTIQVPAARLWIDRETPPASWQCTAEDPEEGRLAPLRVGWRLDGALLAEGGTAILAPTLAPGVHRITAEAHDRWGRRGACEREVVVFEYPSPTDPAGALSGFLCALRARQPARAAARLHPEFRLWAPGIAAPLQRTWLVDLLARLLADRRLVRWVVRGRFRPVETFRWRGTAYAKMEIEGFGLAVHWRDPAGDLRRPSTVWRVPESVARIFLTGPGEDSEEDWNLHSWWELRMSPAVSPGAASLGALLREAAGAYLGSLPDQVRRTRSSSACITRPGAADSSAP